jgi:hypothetical protein
MEITIYTTDQGEAVLGLDNMPGRRRKALYMMHGCRIIPMAYFRNDEDAERVERFLRDLVAMANSSPER